MYHALFFRVNFFATDRLYQQKYKSSTVECREWQKVHDTKVRRKQDTDLQHLQECIEVAVGNTLLIAVSDCTDNSYRTTHIIDGNASGKEHL